MKSKLLVGADLQKSSIGSIESNVLDGSIRSDRARAGYLDLGRAHNWLYGFALCDLRGGLAACRHEQGEGQQGEHGMDHRIHGGSV